ncbi:MAG: chorismate mutase [Alphaproteobacteria bacterium]|nr:MAG: chorismate mutase [Alphaproteobacteria bacterium]
MADGIPSRRTRACASRGQVTGSCATMPELRHRIDRLDEEIVARLVARFGLMEEAARIKGDRARIHDQARIREVLAHVCDRAKSAGAPPEVEEAIAEIYRALVRHSIRYEFMVFDRDLQEDE